MFLISLSVKIWICLIWNITLFVLIKSIWKKHLHINMVYDLLNIQFSFVTIFLINFSQSLNFQNIERIFFIKKNKTKQNNKIILHSNYNFLPFQKFAFCYVGSVLRNLNRILIQKSCSFLIVVIPFQDNTKWKIQNKIKQRNRVIYLSVTL